MEDILSKIIRFVKGLNPKKINLGQFEDIIDISKLTKVGDNLYDYIGKSPTLTSKWDRQELGCKNISGVYNHS